jgi:hypothetical protein
VYNFKNTHIDSIRSGDLVYHDGAIRTVGAKDIKYDSFMGYTLWGDSYRMGTKPVMKVTKYIE